MGGRRRVKHPRSIQLDKSRAIGCLNPNLREDLAGDTRLGSSDTDAS